jgi:hypothetical protein
MTKRILTPRFFAAAGSALVAAGVFVSLAASAVQAVQPDARLVRQLPPPTESAVQVVAQAATPTLRLEPFVDQACLDCHTDQAALLELAIPDDPVESHSEGPG